MSSSRITRRIIHDLVSRSTGDLEHGLRRVQEDKDALRNELRRLQTDLAHLEMEEQLLTQTLRLRRAEKDGAPGAGATVAGLWRETPGKKQESLSANVLSIVRQADEPLLPADVQERLGREGIRADPSAVRVALRRWVERDQLVKEGRYYRDLDDR